MAKVYLVHDQVLHRDIALKMLRDQYAENDEFVERFRREARSAAALNHPNVVSVYDWGHTEDGSYYMAMEYVSGGTLKERILRKPLMDPAKAVAWGSQVARALGFAHERGVIHRDIKPHNILLTQSGEAQVTDFGIAQAATAATISHSSFVLGTASYMSPEQAMGESVGPESDLYSLGIVLYEMLTGVLPYYAESPVAVAMKHVNESPRSPREANPNLPEALDAITLKLSAKDPEDRYASANELVKDLERVRAGLPPLLAAGTVKTVKVIVPFPSDKDGQTKRTATRPPTVASTEASAGGGRRQVMLLTPTLAALIFGVILLGGLAWALTQDRGTSDQPDSEDTPAEVAEPPIVQVPELDYASEAEAALAEAGLKLGRWDDEPSDTVAAGKVIEQDPAAETEVQEGTVVNIVVSTGPQQTPTTQVASPSPPAQELPTTPVASAPTPQQQAPTAQTISAPAASVPAALPKKDEKTEKKQGEKAEEKQERREDKVEERQEQQGEMAEKKQENREEKAGKKRAK
jgi:serine/threonine-protein kinase